MLSLSMINPSNRTAVLVERGTDCSLISLSLSLFQWSIRQTGQLFWLKGAQIVIVDFSPLLRWMALYYMQLMKLTSYCFWHNGAPGRRPPTARDFTAAWIPSLTRKTNVVSSRTDSGEWTLTLRCVFVPLLGMFSSSHNLCLSCPSAGPAQLHGSPSGENCSKVGAQMVLHNMLRRTADLDRELQVCGDVTLRFCLLHDFLRSDSDVIVYVCIWSLIGVPTFLLKTSTHPRPQLYAKAYHPGSVQRPCP
jgi:hypothetical protein